MGRAGTGEAAAAGEREGEREWNGDEEKCRVGERDGQLLEEGGRKRERERKKIQAHHYTYQAAYSWSVLRMAIKRFLGRTSECTVHRPSGTRTLGMTREIEGEALPGSPLEAHDE